MKTLPDILEEQATLSPNEPFLKERGREWLSFSSVFETSKKIAATLKSYGLEKGDNVAILMDNRIEFVLTWFGVNLIGAVEVPINPHLPKSFLEHIFKLTKPKVIVCNDFVVPSLSQLQIDELKNVELIITVGSREQHSLLEKPHKHLEDIINRNKPVILERPKLNIGDTGAILFTSGTTGPSKGIVMPYGHMYALAGKVAKSMKLTVEDCFLVTTPLFHANAQFVQVFSSLIAGNRACVEYKFSASRWLDVVREEGATVTSLIGDMPVYVYKQPVKEDDSENPLRAAYCQPISREIAYDFEQRFGIKCLEAYGTSDAGIKAMRQYDEEMVPGSAGKVDTDFYEVKIVDPETDVVVPPNAVGEIVARPRQPFTMLKGYLDMPEKTVEAWRNLWFHTGDAGKIDDNGNFYFVDRIKDFIRVKGENISSFEIEREVLKYPSVKDCAAVGVKMDKISSEEDIKIFVVVDENGSQFNCANLFNHCQQVLPGYAVPRFIEVIDELPKTPTSKIKKSELKIMGNCEKTWDARKVLT